MAPDLIDNKSALVQVRAWCPQAISHYLKQRWPYDLYRHVALLGHNELMTLFSHEIYDAGVGNRPEQYCYGDS